MTAKSTVAKLAIELIGKDAQLRKTFEESKRQGSAWGAGMQRAASRGAAGLGIVVGAASSAALAINELISQNAQLARELRGQATAANMSAVELQGMAYAARTVAVEQDKVADIFKDLNDRIGDLAATGGGELKDWYENIGQAAGITVEQLQALSGPEALLAIKKSMDDANVSASEQVFYLESIADEASRLSPLLADNGAELRKLRDEYLAMNIAMTGSEMAKLEEYSRDIDLMKESFDALLREAVMPFVDELADGAKWMAEIFSTGRTNMLKGRIHELHTEMVSLNEQIANPRRYQSGAAVDAMRERLKEVKADLYESQERLAQLQGKPAAGPVSAPRVGGGRGNAETQLAEQQAAGLRVLEAMEMQLASEEEKVRLSHERRMQDLAELNLSREEIELSGFETLELLRDDLRARSMEKMNADLQAIEDRTSQSEQRKLDIIKRNEDLARKERDRTVKHEKALQTAWNKQYLAMQLDVGTQAIGMMKQFATEGSALQKAMIIAEKGLAIARTIINTQVASVRALAELGPIAGPPMAAQIQLMGNLSAAMIAATGVAELAGARELGGPVSGGRTYLVGEKGPELFTAGGAGQITSNANLQRAVGGAGGVQVVVNEAPESNGHDVRTEMRDGQLMVVIDERVRQVLNDDVGRGVGVSRTMESVFGLRRRGKV